MHHMSAFQKVKKHAGGARVKLNQDLIDRICNNLRLGTYIETAVVVNGISKSVFYQWAKKGRDSSGATNTTIYGKFLDAVERAQEEAVVRDMMNIDKCAMGQDWDYERHPKGTHDKLGNDIGGSLILKRNGNPIPKKIGLTPDWSASAWRLERRHPGRYSRTEKIEQTGKDGGAQVQIVLTMPSNGREAPPTSNDEDN